MKKTLIGLLGSTVICVLFLAGCIDEHYGEDSNTIVTNLTGYAWERTFQIRTEDGRNAEVCEHYEFGLNGKASCKSRTTCDGEEVEEHVHYFRYDFITPNNRYLLLDYCYWQIDRISSSVLFLVHALAASFAAFSLAARARSSPLVTRKDWTRWRRAGQM